MLTNADISLLNYGLESNDVFISSGGFGPDCQQVQIDSGRTTVYKVRLKASKFLEE